MTHGHGGYSNGCRCEACYLGHAEYAKGWRRRNPVAVHATKVKSKYGLSRTDYETLLEQQKGLCAICGKRNNMPGRRLSVDHDHTTQKVRGLLCNKCNADLGWFEKHHEAIHRYLHKGLL